MTSDCPHKLKDHYTCMLAHLTEFKVKMITKSVSGSVFENASDQPAVLLKTSEAAGLSEMMAVASPVAVRSKVSVPVVVSWPDGLTVTG